jgi:hypothetical protein
MPVQRPTGWIVGFEAVVASNSANGRAVIFRSKEAKKKWYFKVLYMGICTLLPPLCGHGRLMVFQKK